jgi:hypothetical protein
MSKLINISALASALILVGIGNVANAQTKDKNDSLSAETVIIVREFEPVIKDAKKINNQPVIKTVDKKDQEFSYDVVPQNNSYQFTPDTIKAVKLKGEPLTKLYRVYAKAGVGNYLNTLGELHLNSLRSRDLQWGLDVHHLGSNGGIKDIPYNGFSKQNYNLYGKKMLKHHIIDAGLTYDRERVYLYGYNPELLFVSDSVGKDDIQQTFSQFKVHAGLQSFITDSNKWNYNIGLDYYNLSVKPSSTTENNFVLRSEFTKYYGNEKGFLYFDIDYNKPKLDTSFVDQNQPIQPNKPTQYKANTLIKPGIDVRFTGDKWRLTAGFKMALETGAVTNFYIFPNAEFKFNVVRNLIVPYIGVTGGIQRTSINSLRQQNPFISGSPDLLNERTPYNAYLGVRGVYSSNISYNISGGYKQVKDMALFISTGAVFTLPPGISYFENVYHPIYDQVNIAYIKAQVSYQKEDKWNLLWRFTYNNYETKYEVVAWNLPDVTSDLTLRYNLQDKIVAKTSMTFMSGRYVKTDYPQGAEQLSATVYGRKLKPLFDFNLGVEYRFSKKLSAFIDINNILSQNYEIYGNYKVQGINVMGGVTYSFWAK